MVARNFFASIAALCSLSACAPESSEVPAQAPAAESSAPPAPAAAPPQAATSGLPPVIVAERGGFIPEGVEYDRSNGRFLTGSLAEGSIFEIGTDGSVTAVVSDPELVSTVGIEVDEPRDRLVVCNSDSSVFHGGGAGQAKLGVYSLTTGERLAMVDMGAMVPGGDAFFANDVAVTDDGDIYATDTRQNVIYKVDANYTASLFYSFAPVEGLALNGIVYHPAGYLLIADLGNGAIYKTPVGNPAATDQVQISEALSGADGMVWRADGALAVVQNSAENGRVVALTSDDDWSSAEIVAIASHEGAATTAAAVAGEIYSVQPHFADQDPPSLRRADFR